MQSITRLHDERELEAPESELERVKSNVSGLMTNFAKLDVPLVAEPGVGMNWEEAHSRCSRIGIMLF